MKYKSFFSREAGKTWKKKSTEKKNALKKKFGRNRRNIVLGCFCQDKTNSFLNNFKLKKRKIFLNLKYTTYEDLVVKIVQIYNEEFYN